MSRPGREELAHKRAKQKAKREAREAEVTSIRQDIKERKLYASRIFWLMCSWLFVLFAVVCLQEWKIGEFQLPEAVLLALIGGTTANVLGIFVLVTRYLFWKSPKEGERSVALIG